MPQHGTPQVALQWHRFAESCSCCCAPCTAFHRGHNYIGHNYIGHTYIAMAYIIMAYKVMAQFVLRGWYERAHAHHARGTIRKLSAEAVVLGTGTPTPPRGTCRRRCPM